MRLIDADVLRKELRKKLCPIKGSDVYFVRQLIDNAPTIPNEYMRGYEAAEREYKRTISEWIMTSQGDYECSYCKSPHTDTPPFCPWCGAKMKSGEEDED